MKSNRFVGVMLFSSLVALPLVAGGCSGDESNPLCCNEFQVGAQITADIGGSAESQVAAQAVADFAGIASASLDDLTGACRSIAQDLDAAKAEQDAAEGNADKRAKMKAWCALAVRAIGAVKASAGGSITVAYQAPVCEASISAKANCQAKCSGSASCDLKANPPQCTGGKLEVACKGECTAKAGATLACEGKCTGECKGSCTAQGGVACQGKCEGNCKAGGGAGNGIQADGTCKGTCEGTCEVTAPGVTCEGSCKGECTASCTGTAEASVKCDGECKADYEPLSCSGGKLEGGCKAEAKCEGNCDASVKAKAECRPPAITIEASGGVDVEAFGKLKATLEANLGIIVSFEARLKGMLEITTAFKGNIDAVADIKAACIPALIAAAATAIEDVQASSSATLDIVGSVK
jgi:hypothetical protein